MVVAEEGEAQIHRFWAGRGVGVWVWVWARCESEQGSVEKFGADWVGCAVDRRLSWSLQARRSVGYVVQVALSVSRRSWVERVEFDLLNGVLQFYIMLLIMSASLNSSFCA